MRKKLIDNLVTRYGSMDISIGEFVEAFRALPIEKLSTYRVVGIQSNGFPIDKEVEAVTLFEVALDETLQGNTITSIRQVH